MEEEGRAAEAAAAEVGEAGRALALVRREDEGPEAEVAVDEEDAEVAGAEEGAEGEAAEVAEGAEAAAFVGGREGDGEPEGRGRRRRRSTRKLTYDENFRQEEVE